MFRKKNREDEDTLIRPYVPADKLPAVPYIAPDSSEIPEVPDTDAVHEQLDHNSEVSDQPSITDIWQFNRSGEVIYPGRNQYWLWMIRPILRPFDFSGRSPRLEYVLYWLLIFVAVMLRERAFDLFADVETSSDVGMSFVLALMVPLIALSVRRMHDYGGSGWRFLLGVLSVFGIYSLVVDVFSRGDEWPNKYGPAPY